MDIVQEDVKFNASTFLAISGFCGSCSYLSVFDETNTVLYCIFRKIL